MDHLLSCSIEKEKNTIVVAGCAPYETTLEEAALEGSVGAWPVRGP